VVSARAKQIEEASGQFQQQVDRVQQDMETQFERTLSALRGLRGVFRASNDVTRQEFREVVASRDFNEEFPGVRGFGLVVPEAKGRYRVKYIEPVESNPGELGSDIALDPVRKEALERAVAIGA
jgi:CHASE1-domain containing sensor protein